MTEMLREVAEYPNSFSPLGPGDERIDTGRYTLCMGAGASWNTVQQQRFPVADVDDVGDRTTTGGDDEPLGLREVVGSGRRHQHGVDGSAHVERDDVRPLLREPHRLSAPDPPCRTRDERDLSLEPAHD